MSSTDLSALAALSARLGRDPMLVQGGGGNASLKDGGTLWVKASGKWLARAEREPIFVPVALDAVCAAVVSGSADPVTPHVQGDAALRPSIETTLHALLPHRVVVHVHSIHALATAVRRDGHARASERLKGLDWRWLPYCRPGVPLTRAIASLGQPTAAVILLANHGLVVGADDCESAESLIFDVEHRLAAMPRIAPPADDAWLVAEAAAQDMVLPSMPCLHDLATDAVSLRHALAGPLFPDQVVFLGPSLAIGKGAHDAAFHLMPGRGVLLERAITAGQEEMLLCLALLFQRLEENAQVDVLDAGEIDALLGWEAERYRVGLDAGQRR
jgi:rhamnose utilization protein RhaD (predicted bifunctional aldolase and dehydrogenase)